MKGFVKVIATIFAIVIVLLSILVLFVVFGTVSNDTMLGWLGILTATKDAKIISIAISAIMALLSITLIINIDDSDNVMKGDVVLPLKTGNIYITNQTFENIIYNVTRKYDQFKNVKVRVSVKEEGLFVNVFAYILQDTIVSDAIIKLQEDIKSTVIKQTTVGVKSVEVKVKGIYSGGLDKIQE